MVRLRRALATVQRVVTIGLEKYVGFGLSVVNLVERFCYRGSALLARFVSMRRCVQEYFRFVSDLSRG